MPTFWLTKRKRVVYGKRGTGAAATLVYEVPDFKVDLPPEAEVSQAAARAVVDDLRRKWSVGQDATGSPHTAKDSTIKTRQYDKQPPKRNFLGQRRATRTKQGKIRQRTVGNRWQRMFPDGRGSSGNSTALMSSGYLSRNLSITIVGREAHVSVPAARVAAVLAIEKGSYKGAKGPIPLFGITTKPRDATMNDLVKGAEGSMAGAAAMYLGRFLIQNLAKALTS